MSNKFRGALYILNPFIPIIVISTATLILFMFWLKVEPEIAAFTKSFQRVQNTINSSMNELNQILADTKKHIGKTIESSGIPELIITYQTAIRGLDGLCGPQSENAFYSPPETNGLLKQTAGNWTNAKLIMTASHSGRFTRNGNDPRIMNTLFIPEFASMPDLARQRFESIALKLDGGKIKRETKKLKTGLNKALKKAGEDVGRAWEKAKKDVAETGRTAVIMFSQEMEKVKEEFTKTIADLGKAAERTVNAFSAQMDAISKNSCEFVTEPLVTIIKPVLQRSIRPFMHLDNAIEDLKKLITLQVKIKDILIESEKMYDNLDRTLSLSLTLIRQMVYLLAILLVFITIHRITRKTEEIKKGWQLLKT